MRRDPSRGSVRVRVTYGFGWNGIVAATSEIRLSNGIEGQLQLDVTGQTIGVARNLWPFDVTHVSTTDGHTLRPIQVRETEILRSKKVDTELSYTPQGVPVNVTRSGARP